MVFCDIDGCMGDFVKTEYPLKQDISKNEEELIKIKERVSQISSTQDGILFGVCTGRSFYQADHIMYQTGHQGPSIFEMGNVIYDPKEGVYNLFERHEKFKGSVNRIKFFISWKNGMKELEGELKENFYGSGIRQLKDRTCMLTYEFEKDIGNELKERLLKSMPAEVRELLNDGILKIMQSKKAIDILPNLSKGDAVDYLAGLYKVDRKNILAIGDSSHSDLDLLKSAGLIACPDNADEEMKDYVRKHNGLVVPNSLNSGLLNILDVVENFIIFQKLKNSQEFRENKIGGKIKTIGELKEIVEKYRRDGKKITTTNGCFDLLHTGHLYILDSAKNMTDIFIVLINSDASIKRVKGPKRPIIPERERAMMLSALECVDYVMIYENEEDSPLKYLKELKPDVHIKGGSFEPERIKAEKELVESWGGKHIILPLVEGYSSTKIIESIIKTYNPL